MKLRLQLYVLLLISVLTSNCTEKISNNKLWYQQPANKWVEALPLGNGRMGAMVYGGVKHDTIQLNEESLWSGVRLDDVNEQAGKNLGKIRKLIFENKNDEATSLADTTFLGIPRKVRFYEPLANLILTSLNRDEAIRAYRRELDISTGISKVEYNSDGVNYKKEVFISAPDNVIIVRISADTPNSINYSIQLNSQQEAHTFAVENRTLRLKGQVIDDENPVYGPGGEHMKFEALLNASSSDGVFSENEDHLEVRDASDVTIILTAATDYNIEKLNFDRSINPHLLCEGLINKAQLQDYQTIKRRHVADHQSYFNRVTIDLGSNANSALPTDVRLKKLKEGAEDPALLALYFQYGRYLLMGSSRAPGVLPANLQGIWNNLYLPPWGSDYHTNINLQMNYWPAMVTNLSVTMHPLTQFMNVVSESGQSAAQKMYNARGWTLHHLTDVFGRTGVHDGVKWGLFPMGGPWMTVPVYRYYEYTQDETYLRDYAYPLMKGSVEFILDYLVEDSLGQLVTTPSYSPENSFKWGEDKRPMRLTYAPTMDVMIVKEVLNNGLEAMKVLDVDKHLQDKVQTALSKLPAVKVGKDGTIQEWINDYEEQDPGHRHISHLFGLHPGSTITHNQTPELMEAASRTLERRLSHGGGHTGWSRAWIINFYARLHNSEMAYENVINLLKKSTLSNLFDTHPPFQIDGNFGGTAGIAEMLLQSHEGEINLLPALPSQWATGKVTGLKARGGFEVDIQWEANKIKDVVIYAGVDAPCNVRYQNTSIKISAKKGDRIVLNEKLERTNQ